MLLRYGIEEMENTNAYDILDKLPVLDLADYSHVRIRLGREWLDVEIRDGKPTVRGSHALLLRPVTSNQIEITIDVSF